MESIPELLYAYREGLISEVSFYEQLLDWIGPKSIDDIMSFLDKYQKSQFERILGTISRPGWTDAEGQSLSEDVRSTISEYFESPDRLMPIPKLMYAYHEDIIPEALLFTHLVNWIEFKSIDEILTYLEEGQKSRFINDLRAVSTPGFIDFQGWSPSEKSRARILEYLARKGQP